MAGAECQHGEVGTKEWMECSVRQLELVDTAGLVSKVEWPCEVELDMPVLVEEMLEVQVEIVDWARCPMRWKDSDLCMDS